MSFPWLTARPIAHRGLHEAARGRVENTPSAVLAAIAHNYAIECDVQITSDGEAVVFHDYTLERLTHGEGRLDSHRAADLASIGFRQGTDHIMPLGDFLKLIAGRVPLICEIKSRYDGDMRLSDRTLALAQTYSGPLALKSFDPQIIAHLRKIGTRLPLGIIAMASYAAPEWSALTPPLRESMTHFLHYPETRPDFLSWNVDDLPHPTPTLLRLGLHLPVMSWTVRSEAQRQAALPFIDQIVFEHFAP